MKKTHLVLLIIIALITILGSTLGGIFTGLKFFDTRYANAMVVDSHIKSSDCREYEREYNRMRKDNWALSDRYEGRTMPSETRVRYRENILDMNKIDKKIDKQCSAEKGEIK